jgi:integrase
MRSAQKVVRKRLADGTVKEYRYDRATRSNAKGGAGTVGDMIARYLDSPEFAALAPATRKLYPQGLNPLLDHPRIRHLDARTIRRSDIMTMRDGLASRPGMADLFVTAVGSVYKWGIDRDLVEINPAQRIPRLSKGEHRRWTADEVEAILVRGLPVWRMAAALALFTGQRQGDVIAMRWADYRHGLIYVKQAKTKTPLTIPAHPLLVRALGEWPRRTETILFTQYGTPFTGNGFRTSWRLERERLGIKATWHGLRKTAAAALAEQGATAHEIASITGHRSLREIERYTREADQLQRARMAVSKMVSWFPETTSQVIDV